MKIAKEVEEIIRRLEEAGYEAYAVGGGVRDALLGREPGDWDVATGASAETVTALFPRTVQIGARFGIVKVLHGDLAVDVAAYRIDGPYSDCRRPDRVVFTANLEEDLKRRDFTINAMAYSPIRGFADPFNGRRDLEDRIIRAVGDPGQRFREDALRIIRGIRFAAQLGFVIEPRTLAAMGELAPLLEKISMERIREEFRRILIAPYAGQGLLLCERLRILPHILGAAFTLEDERERIAFEALAAGIDGTESDWHVRLGLLLSCFDKSKAASAIERLKLDNASAEKLRTAILLADELAVIDKKIDLKRFISINGYSAYEFCEKLIGMLAELGTRLDMTGGDGARKQNDRQRWIREIERGREPVLLRDLAVDGSDLTNAGFKAGREMGAMLQDLLDLVHRQPGHNNKELLMAKAAERLKE